MRRATAGYGSQVVRLLVLVAVAALLPETLWAQSSAGLAGTVRDASGVPVSGARVVLTGADIGVRREAMTGVAGAFEFLGLLPATGFELATSADGFAPSRHSVAPLGAGEQRLVDLRLDVAAVEVVAANVERLVILQATHGHVVLGQ